MTDSWGKAVQTVAESDVSTHIDTFWIPPVEYDSSHLMEEPIVEYLSLSHCRRVSKFTLSSVAD